MDNAAGAEALERFRPYLRLLARLHLGRQLQRKLDASDIVQETLLQACRGLERFRGRAEPEMAAWLRRILVRTLAHAARDAGRAKRDIGRERSLEAAVEQSSGQLEAWLAAAQSSPSQRAQRGEDAVRLARVLETLPPARREVIILRHLEGWPLAEISRHLGRSPAAVAGLLHRGLAQLREKLREAE